MIKNNTKNAPLVLLGTIFAVAALLRFYQLDRTLGGADENAMLLYFGYSPLKVITTSYWDANNHIFHSILVRLMGTWFGEENAIAIRFPTFLFGLGGLWLIYRIAQELFDSPLIARMSLLIAAVNPVHIHYSQTARGYSLIIFFSAAMILLSLKVLRSGISVGRGILLAGCGFLSVYTIPTNIYFLFGLAVWIFGVLLLPDRQRKFSIDAADRKRKLFFFLNVALAIAVFCWVAYAPLLGQMIETMTQHQMMTVETQWNSVSVLIPGILEKVFPASLLLFLPFLAMAFVSGDAPDRSYRTLPLVIFFLPLAVTLITG
ncbi:MAG: glycosyltransferase family 39 protein, partial [Nitrospinae bacterium]|nr:glycosyltransferase family 39 protein [Nitrospinota bacterium]